MKSPTNVTSNQEMQKSIKIRNTLTSFTHIVMKIMSEIYLADSQLHEHFVSSIVPLHTGVPRNNLKPQDTVPMQKQEKCTQEYYIHFGSETSLYQLVTP